MVIRPVNLDTPLPIVSILSPSAISVSFQPRRESAPAKCAEPSSGSADYAHERVLRYTRAAKDALGPVPESRARSLLLELTNYLATRCY